MITMKHGLIGVALALAGCGAGSDVGQAASKGPTANASKSVAVKDLPSLRPGLWRTKMVEGELADGEPEERCVGPEDTDLLGSLGGGEDSQCSKREVQRIGDRYAFDIACASEYVNATVKGSFRGDFTKHVAGELVLGLAPPGKPIETKRYRYESRYAGTCTPDTDK